MTPYSELVTLSESISNRADMPGRVVDWAADLYDQLTERHIDAKVCVEDLQLLQAFGVDEGHGLFMIDNALARRGK